MVINFFLENADVLNILKINSKLQLVSSYSKAFYLNLDMKIIFLVFKSTLFVNRFNKNKTQNWFYFKLKKLLRIFFHYDLIGKLAQIYCTTGFVL